MLCSYWRDIAPNRPLLGTLGVIPRVAELLELEGIKPVQYGATGILKNLSAGENGNLQLELSLLIDLIKHKFLCRRKRVSHHQWPGTIHTV